MDYKRIMLVRPDNRCGWGFMWSPLAINLEYIAANIESDVDKIMIINQEFDNSPIIDHIKNFKPDLLGVTMSATEHNSGLNLCKTAKKHGITTAVGGYHPTAIPMDMMKNPQVDMVFRGESEITFKEFIKQGTPEGIPGITYRNNGNVINNSDRPLIEDLDSLPFPARHLRKGDECKHWLDLGLGHRDQVHTSRGCWGRCTFCCEPSMSLSQQRYRSPENIMKEIKEVYKLHDEERMHILFGDPHLMGKADRIGHLSDLLISENMNITFTAMVRADSIARNSETVKKMVKAGIIGYCMGIESPGQGALNEIKKGISAKIQKDAVRLLRENHAIAGGTFIIGLPGQTEEEIKTFPEYARSLGMINAAFAIVTPQAGTEFYEEMDSKGLINDRDWSSYDQMHSVFNHDKLSKDRLEQLLTHCIGRFYAPDIFIDDMVEAQLRNNDTSKITLHQAFEHLKNRMRFVMAAGKQYRPTDSREYGSIFLKAQINPWTRMRTQKIGIHNMIQLDSFLRAFGNQKVQISLKKDGKPFVHYVLKTTKTTVEYLEICEKPHTNATLNIELDFQELHNGRSNILAKVLSKIIKRNEIVPVIRGVLALFIDYINVTKSARKTQNIPILPKYKDKWFLIDGWDEEEYQKLKSNVKPSSADE